MWLTNAQAKAIIDHARAAAPHEACGLIGGTDGRAVEVVPVENVAATPATNYELDPAQQANVMSRFYKDGLDLVAIYHAHPTTPPVPSQTDIRSAAYPDAVYLIVSLQATTADLAAWHIRGGEVTRAPLHIGATPPPPHTEESKLSPAQKAAIIIATAAAFLAVIAYSIYLLPPAPPLPGG